MQPVFDSTGFIPAIVQDANTKGVLMLAYMNAESLQKTLETGQTYFWSRSRNELWHKGATSGNTQQVVDIRLDCDGDALLVLVNPAGPACHTGQVTCFHNSLDEKNSIPRSGEGRGYRGGLKKDSLLYLFLHSHDWILLLRQP